MENAVLAVVLTAIVAVLVKALLKGGAQIGKYKARKLLTENETEFFRRMVAAFPDHYIFPQVAMSALLEATSSDKSRSHADRLRIAQQRVDYVVCDKNCKVVAVVELDDSTHSRSKDQVRDARLQQGGIRTVRFQSKSKPNVEGIRQAVFPVTQPAGSVSVTL